MNVKSRILLSIVFAAVAACTEAKPIRVLAVGEGVSEVEGEYIRRIAREKGHCVDLVSRGASDWRQADGSFDFVVLVPPSGAAKTKEGLAAWGNALVAELRTARPGALLLLRQPFSWDVGDIAAYDALSLNCMHFTVRHDIGTMPAGFAWQCYRMESENGRVPAEYLDACVWVEKLCEANVRVLAYRPAGKVDPDDCDLARRCAVEAVRIFSPVPVRNCALEAIGRMTPMPVEADWWKKRLAEKKREIAALNGEADLVFVGSSQIHIWETRCPRQLRDIHRDFKLLNLGYSGDSFQKVCWRLTKGRELDGYKAKCIMLVQGGNNTSEVPTALVLGMKQILDIFAVKQPQAKVLLLPINPRREWDCGTAPRPRPRVDRANEMLKHYADGKRVFWVDFREELYDDNDDTAWCMPGDRLHLGSEGLKIWYSHISPLFHEICGKPVPPETEGWVDRRPDVRKYVQGDFVWAARLDKRGGFELEKVDGAEGKVEFLDGRIMVHKTNARGALVLKAHPFASHTNIKVRVYADVEVVSSGHARSTGYLSADGFGLSEPEHELEARPEGCRIRRYFHVVSTNGDIRPRIVVAGAPSKTYWSNWRAEDLVNPRRDGRLAHNPERTAPDPLPATFAGPRAVAIVTDELDADALRQLRIIEGSSLLYSLHPLAEFAANPAAFARTRLLLFLGVRKIDGRVMEAVRSLSAPARTLVYLGGTGVDGGLKEVSGFTLKTAGSCASPVVTSESVRWPDLETGVYGLVASPLASVEKEDKVVSFAHYGADVQAKCVALRREANGCRHVCICAPCGLTPEYFNRLARESGVRVPTDETGLRLAVSGRTLELECYQSGRYDVDLDGAVRAVNLQSGRQETVEGGVLKVNLVAGGVYRFETESEPAPQRSGDKTPEKGKGNSNE